MKNTTTLLPIRNIKALLQYALKDYPGAMRHPFLAKQAAKKLELAAAIVRQKTAGRRELCIWDAHRSVETQRHIFDDYRKTLAAKKPGLSAKTLLTMTCEFVRNPDTVFPHGTGGAVDVTLLASGKPVNMGTGFDDFLAKSAPDFFDRFPPENAEDAEAARNRDILRDAMLEAGFVGIDSEWWHFEFGTATWAETTGEDVLLAEVLPPPLVESTATADHLAPSRQPCHQTGVAQVFTDPEHRAASLAHELPAHYYVRNSQPTIDDLQRCLGRVFQAEHVLVLPSGLSAFLTVCRGLAPRNGRIVMDERCYYECQGSTLVAAADKGWNVSKVPLWAGKQLQMQVPGHTDLVVVDNPTNWFLDSLPVERLAQACANVGATLAVDVSVQPIQGLTGKGDIVGVLSLSKYPSAGLEVGGAIFTNNEDAFKRISAIAGLEGLVMSIGGAERILEHALWLQDRIETLSRKALLVRDFLQTHPAVKSVRVASADNFGGLVGGQLTFQLNDWTQGHRIEQVIGHNSLNPRSCLNLACTFGATMTSFEHFASNTRHRQHWTREETNEASIPRDMCRLGIGAEPADRIIEELNFLLTSTMNETPRKNMTFILSVAKVESKPRRSKQVTSTFRGRFRP